MAVFPVSSARLAGFLATTLITAVTASIALSQDFPDRRPPDGAPRGPTGPGPMGPGSIGEAPMGHGPMNQGAPIASTAADTSSILCDVDQDARNAASGLRSVTSWRCSGGQRVLSANGLPQHAIGTFPNAGNPNRIAEQAVQFATTLRPVARTGAGVRVKEPAYALNGVVFDPGTAGTCDSGATRPSSCDLGRGQGEWRIEALGQDSFNFGVDANNAHVQPGGKYHYHGVPEGLLDADARAGGRMQLVGWAADGFPVYARFGHAQPLDAASPLRAMRSSYRLKIAPDPGRPATGAMPMGAFMQDYEYVADSGDLDECNGRSGATPEFPKGIYHYYVTDTYPFVQRCVKGSPAQGGGPPGPRR